MFRPFKVIQVDEFGVNRKRICDFLLVRNSNFGPILHHFGVMTAFMCSWPHPYSTLILGVFRLHQIAHVGRQRAHGPYAIRPWNYFRRIPTYVSTVPDRYGQTDGQTDGRTTCNLITLASRGKKTSRKGKSELQHQVHMSRVLCSTALPPRVRKSVFIEIGQYCYVRVHQHPPF